MPPVVEFADQPAKIGSLSKQDIYPCFDFIDIIH